MTSMPDDLLLSLCRDPAARDVMLDNLSIRKGLIERNTASISRMKSNLAHAEQSLRIEIEELSQLQKALDKTAGERNA